MILKSSQAIQKEPQDTVIHATSFIRSDAQYERNRLNLYRVLQKAAKACLDTQKEREDQGVIKPQKAVDNFSTICLTRMPFYIEYRVKPDEKVVLETMG